MLKEFIGRLKVANDVNTLDCVDLETKYLSSEELYNEFLSNFAVFYDRNLLYQLRIAEENDKIKKLISKGNNKYPNRDNDTYYEKILSGMTHVEDRFSVQHGGKDVSEAMCLLRDSIGYPYMGDDSFDHKRISKFLLAAGERYLDCSEDDISDFLVKAYYTTKIEGFKKEDLKDFIAEYKEQHPMLSLCNNPHFLFFVNYMTYHNRDSIDANFYKNVEDIIKASEVLQHVGMGRDKYMDSNYRKLAKYTLSEAARFKKRQDNKDKDRIAKLRRVLN